MKILGIETSTNVTSVAICEDNNILGSMITNTPAVHSKTLMPMVAATFDATDIDLNEIDIFAVSCGPGSFTGVRVGISVIKGFAVACDKPVAAIPTLYSLMNNVIENILEDNVFICALIDARCKNVYAAVWGKTNGDKVDNILDTCVVPVDWLYEYLLKLREKCNVPIILVGNGVNLCYNNRDDIFYVPSDILVLPSAISICNSANSSEFHCVVEDLNPVYLKLPQFHKKK